VSESLKEQIYGQSTHKYSLYTPPPYLHTRTPVGMAIYLFHVEVPSFAARTLGFSGKNGADLSHSSLEDYRKSCTFLESFPLVASTQDDFWLTVG